MLSADPWVLEAILGRPPEYSRQGPRGRRKQLSLRACSAAGDSRDVVEIRLMGMNRVTQIIDPDGDPSKPSKPFIIEKDTWYSLHPGCKILLTPEKHHFKVVLFNHDDQPTQSKNAPRDGAPVESADLAPPPPKRLKTAQELESALRESSSGDMQDDTTSFHLATESAPDATAHSEQVLDRALSLLSQIQAHTVDPHSIRRLALPLLSITPELEHKKRAIEVLVAVLEDFYFDHPGCHISFVVVVAPEDEASDLPLLREALYRLSAQSTTCVVGDITKLRSTLGLGCAC